MKKLLILILISFFWCCSVNAAQQNLETTIPVNAWTGTGNDPAALEVGDMIVTANANAVKQEAMNTELYAGVIPLWITGTDYPLNYLVRDGKHIYYCKIVHTSGTNDDEPGTGAVWSTYWGYSGEDLYAAIDHNHDSAYEAKLATCTDGQVKKSSSGSWVCADDTDTNTQLSDAQVEAAYNNQVPVVSAGEISAGTETAIRRFSPATVKAIVDAFAGGGSMTWPSVAGIPYWISGAAWGGAYNDTTTIPANYLPDLSGTYLAIADMSPVNAYVDGFMNLAEAAWKAYVGLDDVWTSIGITDGATHFGTFTGSLLTDNQTAKALFQILETAVESNTTNSERYHQTAHINPDYVYANEGYVELDPKTTAALTISEIYIRLNEDPTTELSVTCYQKTAAIDHTTPTTIGTGTTTAGILTVSSGFTDATVPSGSMIWCSVGTDPDVTTVGMTIALTGSYD